MTAALTAAVVAVLILVGALRRAYAARDASAAALARTLRTVAAQRQVIAALRAALGAVREEQAFSALAAAYHLTATDCPEVERCDGEAL